MGGWFVAKNAVHCLKIIPIISTFACLSTLVFHLSIFSFKLLDFIPALLQSSLVASFAHLSRNLQVDISVAMGPF